MKPTAEELRKLFHYDDNSGVLTRKIDVATNAKASSAVGWINGDGYLNVKINRRTYKVHQVVWCWFHGKWANGVIDHINMVKTDNRICNLRDTTIQVNNINRGIRKDSKTGIPNVTWHERDKKYYAACKRDGKQNYLGSFVEISDAIKAVENFKKQYEIGRSMK